MLYPTKVGNVKGINLPHMPASDSDYITIVNAQQGAAQGSNCAIENSPTTIHALRTISGQSITLNCLMLKSDGTQEDVTLALSSPNVWATKSFSSENVAACILYIGGSMQGQVHVYFT